MLSNFRFRYPNRFTNKEQIRFFVFAMATLMHALLIISFRVLEKAMYVL